MDNLYQFYQEFSHKHVQTGQYVPEHYEWLQWYKPVPQQLRTPSIIQEELNSAVLSWNYTQTAKLVKFCKENINLIESSCCN